MKKTNRTFKRFAAITSASLLAACMVAPMAGGFTSSAAENVSLSMTAPSLPTDAIIDETVSAYEVFKISKVAGTTDQYNIDNWGDHIDPQTLLTKIKANTLFGTGNANIFNDISYDSAKAAESAKKVGLALSELNTTELKEAFAKDVINSLKQDASAVTGTYSNEEVSFATIPDGYYIMTCNVKGTDNNNYTSESLGMLTIVDGVPGMVGTTGEAKIGLPSVIKKVQEESLMNDGTAETTSFAGNPNYALGDGYNDVADYDIGDSVPFKLYGTMPGNLAEYNAYYYCFNDTLDEKFDTPTNIKITVGNTILYCDANGKQYTDDTFKTEVQAKDNNCIVSYSNGNLKIAFENIKAYTGVDSATVVTVEYNAVLKTNAAIKDGQKNKVNLTYSNNPNFTYNPTIDGNDEDKPNSDNTGNTPDDTVIVHTYAFEFDKKFFNAAGGEITEEEIKNKTYETTDEHNGAKFTLLSGSGNATTPLYFVKLDNDSNYDYAVAKSGTPNAITELELTNLNNGTESVYSDDKLVIRIKGLDEGVYTLRETQAPDGFNKADDMKITITATTANGQGWKEEDASLTEFKYIVGEGNNAKTETQVGDAITAEALATMENRKGTSLPSTGGIGTTIFYLGGGAMAAIGGIYLISKRRMKKSEE